MSRLLELYTISTHLTSMDRSSLAAQQSCAYLGRRCLKIRKSQPDITIGTCSVSHGTKQAKHVIICPHRFLERGQVFLDCLHLLTLHEPGNELHSISEVEIPGGSVDYFLVSVRDGQVMDFVGIEMQALDTTGTLWPTRQQFLNSVGVAVDQTAPRTFGINWKMTVKTTLVQLHHKVQTFAGLGRHLVLVLQDKLLSYMRHEFTFEHIQSAKLGHTLQFHAYALRDGAAGYRMDLASRNSTDVEGIALAMGLQTNPNVEMQVILSLLQSKLSSRTLLRL